MREMVTLGCLILLVSMAVLTSATIGSSSELLAEKPIWHVGDSWTFQRLRGGNFAYYFTLTVVDVRANFDKRKKCYKVQYESFDREWKIYEQYRSFWYFTEDLIYLGLERKDGTIEKPFGGNEVRNFKWPLKDKKFWRQDWNEPGFSGQVESNFWVSSIEVTVPAGNFKTFKILHEFHHTYGRGRNFNEHWYAPEVKYVVKQYFKFDESTNELVKYQVR